MKPLAWMSGLLLLQTTVGLADPPNPAPPPTATRCTVTTPSAVFVAMFDLSSMMGTLTADGPGRTRRFKVKAVPYAATYSLVFQGYGPLDQKPGSETLTPAKSVVARLVAYGDVNHLFFDSDYHPSVQAGMDGFVCQ
jgi:hypothetical protein